MVIGTTYVRRRNPAATVAPSAAAVLEVEIRLLG
jgi:hypothetical protein